MAHIHVEPTRDTESSGAGLIVAGIVLLGGAYGVACLMEPYLMLIALGLVALWIVRSAT